MTVAELIVILQTYDQKLPVVSGGFDEAGYDLTHTVKAVELVQVEPASHCGDFERVEDVRAWRPAIGKPFDAVLIDV